MLITTQYLTPLPVHSLCMLAYVGNSPASLSIVSFRCPHSGTRRAGQLHAFHAHRKPVTNSHRGLPSSFVADLGCVSLQCSLSCGFGALPLGSVGRGSTQLDTRLSAAAPRRQQEGNGAVVENDELHLTARTDFFYSFQESQ